MSSSAVSYSTCCRAGLYVSGILAFSPRAGGVRAVACAFSLEMSALRWPDGDRRTLHGCVTPDSPAPFHGCQHMSNYTAISNHSGASAFMPSLCSKVLLRVIGLGQTQHYKSSPAPPALPQPTFRSTLGSVISQLPTSPRPISRAAELIAHSRVHRATGFLHTAVSKPCRTQL